MLDPKAAFTSGALAGVASQAVIAVGWWALHSYRAGTIAVLIGLTATAVVLGAAPFLGLWFMRRLVRTAAP